VTIGHDAIVAQLRDRFAHVEREGNCFYTIEHRNGESAEYSESAVIKAYYSEAIIRGMHENGGRLIPLEEFLWLGDRYNFQESIRLLHEGYDVDALKAAADHGIDISLLDALHEV